MKHTKLNSLMFPWHEFNKDSPVPSLNEHGMSDPFVYLGIKEILKTLKKMIQYLQ